MSANRRLPTLHASLRVDGARCVVVGGSAVAVRRAQRLAEAGANVVVVAPTAVTDLDRSGITWEPREYRSGDVEGAFLVVSATGIDDVDARVVADATDAGALVNDATDPARSTVTFPAMASTGPVSVSIDTGGQSPALTAWLRHQVDDTLDRILGTHAAELVELLATVRAELIAVGRSTEHPGWAAALDGGLARLVSDGDLDAARDHLRRHLDLV
jgi:precorrin-2 dehydrogenase / sirohydrochlorin ferrochelatase